MIQDTAFIIDILNGDEDALARLEALEAEQRPEKVSSITVLELSGELITEGQRIDREDCVVAATALQEGEPVVTRNTDHFERIPGLDVVSY